MFEELRMHRKALASSRNIAPFQILGDVSLREMAKYRPTSLLALRQIYGIGENKLKDLGEQLIKIIIEVSKEHKLQTDLKIDRPILESKKNSASLSQVRSDAKKIAYELFLKNESIEKICEQCNRSRTTVVEYLCEYLLGNENQKWDTYISERELMLVKDAVSKVGKERLKPIYLELQEKVSYDNIRIALSILNRLDGEV